MLWDVKVLNFGFTRHYQIDQKTWNFDRFCDVKTQRKVLSLFSGFSGRFPPYLLCCLQNTINFCSIWSLLSLEKYVGQKFSLCLFSKKIEFVCFPPFLPPYFKKVGLFCLKERILMGNRQTKIFYKKMKGLGVWDASTCSGCTKRFKLQ